MALPSSISNTIALAKVTSYLASYKLAKGALFPTTVRTEPRYPLMITVERIIVEKINDADPTYDDLAEAAYYLRDLCGRYINQAQGIVDGGSSGTVAGTTSSSVQFPIYITSGDFTTATFYPNTNIYGNNILIFLNEINRYLLQSEFTLDSTGITISVTGFNAQTTDYNLIIEKVY